MRISVDWLAEFIETPSVEILVETLANLGVEVDQVLDPKKHVTEVVVAEIEQCEPHATSDKLKICTVFDGSARFTVVCGAANAAAGARVAFAKVGATLPAMTIGKRKVQGVESQGMLCSKAELGLEDKSDGIWLLSKNLPMGENLFDVIKMPAVLVLSVTPNRPDLLSHIGIARELSAALGKRLQPSKWRLTEKGPPCASLARLVVEETQACRRYVARVVQGVKVGPSPQWLKERLERVGQRSINNVVDATNYVLMEMGQPLHAFDLSRLAQEAGLPTLRVRYAKAGESLKTLDGNTRQLHEKDLVIADAQRPVALAGIMGGAHSEVCDSTASVLLESAYFEPTVVRQVAKRHNLRTEASHRFERGADIGIALKAVDRCAQLLAEIADGDVAKGFVEFNSKVEVSSEIVLRLEQIPRILGIQLSAEAVVQLLEPLEIRFLKRNGTKLHFEAPTFRPDLTREIDLIEEIARRYGYNNINESLPSTASPVVLPAQTIRSRHKVARETLLLNGCNETVTYGFGSPEIYTQFMPEVELVRLLNPSGEELSAMRPTLLPGLLNVLNHNRRHGVKSLSLFEVGTVFKKQPTNEQLDERNRDLPSETLNAAFVMMGGRYNNRWYQGQKEIDFADIAGIVESLVDAFFLPVKVTLKPTQKTAFNPYATAEICAGDKVLGYVGQLHPEYTKRFELDMPVFAAELSLDALQQLGTRKVQFQALPKFPGTRRDVAVIVSRDISSETIRQFLVENAGGKLGQEIIEHVHLFDVYTGKPIPETHISLAFAIEYRSTMRTLTDAEVSEAFEAVQQALQQKFALEIRH